MRLCLRTGPLVFSSRGSKGATSAPGERSFFALPEPGFRWCSAVSDPLPSGCRGVRLCLRTGPLVFFVGVPKVPLRPLGNDRFLLCLSPDLDGVQPFRIHCQAAAVVRLCGLGCVTFFANDWCFFLFL